MTDSFCGFIEAVKFSDLPEYCVWPNGSQTLYYPIIPIGPKQYFYNSIDEINTIIYPFYTTTDINSYPNFNTPQTPENFNTLHTPENFNTPQTPENFNTPHTPENFNNKCPVYSKENQLQIDNKSYSVIKMKFLDNSTSHKKKKIIRKPPLQQNTLLSINFDKIFKYQQQKIPGNTKIISKIEPKQQKIQDTTKIISKIEPKQQKMCLTQKLTVERKKKSIPKIKKVKLKISKKKKYSFKTSNIYDKLNNIVLTTNKQQIIKDKKVSKKKKVISYY